MSFCREFATSILSRNLAPNALAIYEYKLRFVKDQLFENETYQSSLLSGLFCINSKFNALFTAENSVKMCTINLRYPFYQIVSI